jgi:hypothetical protein
VELPALFFVVGGFEIKLQIAALEFCNFTRFYLFVKNSRIIYHIISSMSEARLHIVEADLQIFKAEQQNTNLIYFIEVNEWFYENIGGFEI